MDGLALTQLTHGDGAGRGDGVDDEGVETASLPSHATTTASAMPGDLDDFDDHQEIILTPKWAGLQPCLAEFKTERLNNTARKTRTASRDHSDRQNWIIQH